jgi:hypothetical protein
MLPSMFDVGCDLLRMASLALAARRFEPLGENLLRLAIGLVEGEADADLEAGRLAHRQDREGAFANWAKSRGLEGSAQSGGAAAPWLKRLADQIGASRDLAAKAPAAWSGEQIADTIGGANKAGVEQILYSLAAPLKPSGTSSGSSGSSGGVDSWAFSSDRHIGRPGIRVADRPTAREATHRRRPIAVGRSGRFGTIVPPVWLRIPCMSGCLTKPKRKRHVGVALDSRWRREESRSHEHEPMAFEAQRGEALPQQSTVRTWE